MACAAARVSLCFVPYRDLSPEHDAFVAINRLAACGIVAGDPYQVDFRADDPAGTEWQQEMLDLSDEQVQGELILKPFEGLTRGQFCQRLWQQVKASPLRGFVRRDLDDADADGIPDGDDPTPFTAAPEIVWSVRPPAGDEDGLPESMPEENATVGPVLQFNFGPRGESKSAGFINDFGGRYDPLVGHGWKESIGSNSRRRGERRETICDTFLFTRDEARWECDLPDGKWQVTVCVGDSAHDQPGQRVTVEGSSVIDNFDTAAGRFCERTVVVSVNDGRLTVDLGPQQPGQNTCLNWLRIAPPLTK